MMQACLGVTTCDKCGRLMEKGQPILVLAEGDITESGDELTFQGSGVRYACHLDCWDGFEQNSLWLRQEIQILLWKVEFSCC